MSTGDVNGQTSDLLNGLHDVNIEDEAVDDDNDLALKGMILLLNNNWDESRELFAKYKSQSIVMHYGGAFLNYVQGIVLPVICCY